MNAYIPIYAWFIVFLYFSWLILTEKMGEKKDNEKIPFWKDRFWKILAGAIVAVVAIITGFVTITGWYNSQPQMKYQTQSASTNSTPNACTIQAYSTVCPLSLTDGQPAFIYLENTGGYPATFFINFSLNPSNPTKLTYYSNSTFAKAGQVTYFGFTMSFSNYTGTFSIHVNASCSADFPSFCRNPNLPYVCDYRISKSGQPAMYVPKSVN